VGVIVQKNDGHGTMVKENDGGKWSSDGVVLWLGRRQNRDVVEWWGEWPMFRLAFYNNGGWQSGCQGRVACRVNFHKNLKHAKLLHFT
jgi:hypothetical protein